METARSMRTPAGTPQLAVEPDLAPLGYEIVDERFGPCRGDRHLERHYSGCGWAEGPVWFAPGRYLVWSDIPGDRLLRWDETTGAVGVFRSPSGHANGHTVDREGRLLSCEHGNRRVTRTEHDGSVTVVAERYQDLAFNSPNDVVTSSDGSIWFTDPDYGIRGWYEGHKAEGEIGARQVYRVDPEGTVTAVAGEDFDQPNGLAFSLDETVLYVVDSGRGHIRAFDVDWSSGRLGQGRVLVVAPEGTGLDGIRLDDEGRIWAAAGRGVNCYGSDGALLGRITVPEPVANLAFGGTRRNRLFIAATTSLYSVRLAVRGPALR